MDENRRIGRDLAHLSDDLNHPLDAVAAVGADDVGAGLDALGRGLFRTHTHHRVEFAVGAELKCEGADDFTIGVFFGRFDGDFRLIQRAHRFDADRIRAALFQGNRLVFEGVVQLVFGDIAHHQQFPGRADGGDDPVVVTGRFLGEACCGFVDLGNAIGETEMLELVAGAAETVALYHICAGSKVFLRDLAHIIRPFNTPKLGTFT